MVFSQKLASLYKMAQKLKVKKKSKKKIVDYRRAIDKHTHKMIDTWEYVHWDEIQGLIEIAKRKAIGIE